MIPDDKLDLWIEHNKNVLISGAHGIGKTAIIVSAFERHNLKYRYFSAATMDPWVDFIGIPKEKKGEDGKSYLELVRPKEFEDDEVEALMFDELNRAPKKIRNAVLELIQFKSINGRKFKNLRFVWAAINPDDEEGTYDVDKLDPAQEDRFHIKITLPNVPDKKYFVLKYGEEIGSGILEWWGNLTDKSKDREKISPRRIDYAIESFQQGIDIRDVLPKGINVDTFMRAISAGPVAVELDKLLKAGVEEDLKAFFRKENNYSAASQLILKAKYCSKVLGYLPKEKVAALFFSNKINTPEFRVLKGTVIDNYKNEPYLSILGEKLMDEDPLALQSIMAVLPAELIKQIREAQKGNVAKEAPTGPYDEITETNMGINWTPGDSIMYRNAFTGSAKKVQNLVEAVKDKAATADRISVIKEITLAYSTYSTGMVSSIEGAVGVLNAIHDAVAPTRAATFMNNGVSTDKLGEVVVALTKRATKEKLEARTSAALRDQWDAAFAKKLNVDRKDLY